MLTRIATIAGLALMISVGAIWFVQQSQSTKPEAQYVEVIDPFWAQYTYLYGVRQRDGKIVPWMASLKDKGPVTDLDGTRAVLGALLPQHPGCVSVEVNFDQAHNKGFQWHEPGDRYPASISSMSEKVQLLACRKTVPEFDAIVQRHR